MLGFIVSFYFVAVKNTGTILRTPRHIDDLCVKRSSTQLIRYSYKIKKFGHLDGFSEVGFATTYSLSSCAL